MVEVFHSGRSRTFVNGKNRRADARVGSYKSRGSNFEKHVVAWATHALASDARGGFIIPMWKSLMVDCTLTNKMIEHRIFIEDNLIV